MNRNKSKIFGLALILILSCSTAAYAAWGMTGVSKITNLSFTCGGYSYTSTTEVCDSVVAKSWLYQDDVFVSYDGQDNPNATWAQGNVSANNPWGVQTWRIDGYHKVVQGQYMDQFNTNATGRS
jgi:hypothetical protein